jgi:glycosyltransferase involved in cell wall biosynthesis
MAGACRELRPRRALGIRYGNHSASLYSTSRTDGHCFARDTGSCDRAFAPTWYANKDISVGPDQFTSHIVAMYASFDAVISMRLFALHGTKVFVFLADVFGVEKWRKRVAQGGIPGMNDVLPYGYHHAAGEGWSIEFSKDADESAIGRLVRRALTRVFGFDLIHAWRNRRSLMSADVVWTHTEREHLAALALFVLLRRRKRPKIIAQCIWLFDRWHRLSAPRRAAYRWLLSRADVVTTHSRSNLAVAREVLPASRSELLLFGCTSAEDLRPIRQQKPVHRPIRVASLGGDMHRDWETHLSAFAGRPGFEVRIATGTARLRVGEGVENVRVAEARSVGEVRELYDWADIVVVPLKENRHVSGITVILEAVASGVPVVASDMGGLQDYFAEGEVCYVPAGDPLALRGAVWRLARDDARRVAMAAAAQTRLLAGRLTSEGYALRHRELSTEILGVRVAGSGRATAPSLG